MSEYARGFVENRIDLSVLPSLTDNIWKFGVLFGDRRKMPRAMRDLGNVEVAVPEILNASSDRTNSTRRQ
jgi:hypothetical protein